eukprot:c10438_g1_i1 orf=135-1142(+)
MKITVDELDVFKLSGPTYLVESGEIWNQGNSVQAAMACLVQAVYALDKDRSVVKMGLAPLAPDWHLPFKYRLVKTLQEEEGSEQVVGAVFKWSRRLAPMRAGAAPKVVVALRGTIPFGDTLKRDLSADLDVVMLQLHTAPRFLVALREVEHAIARYGEGKVCLTGHSLGAAVCLLVGRTLAQRNCFIDAHLFNPPFPSLDHLLSLKALAASFAANFLNQEADGGDAPAGRLESWCPHLYVNTHDPICASYVAYFQSVESVALQKKKSWRGHGLRSKVQSWVGVEAMPFHLIPSAYLHFTDSADGFWKAHAMKQWWSHDASHLIHTRFAGLLARAT